MADCSGCPYRWHDYDCEYCSKKNDEIIDTKSYSKETCPHYKAYISSKSNSSTATVSSSSDSFSSSDGGGCGGCFVFLLLLPILIVVVSVILTLILSLFDIEFSLVTWLLEKLLSFFFETLG